MLKTIILAENPFEPSTWTTHDVENVCDFLISRFKSWPAEAYIYHHQIAQSCDVTPADELGIQRLQELEGKFYVVIYPTAFGIPWYYWTLNPYIIAAVLVWNFLHPDVEKPKTYFGSSNNGLSQRSNQSRVNDRIPDIFGQVRSIPDLIAVPYSVYENNTQVEYSYMCIGRGQYSITDVKDGSTLVDSIDGDTIHIYGPNKSPNNSSPDITIGAATLPEPVLAVRRFDTVNGQNLRSPNLVMRVVTATGVQDMAANPRSGPNNLYCLALINGSSQDFTMYYTAGQTISLADPNNSSDHFMIGGGAHDLKGTYTIDSVTPNYLYLQNAEGVNSNWNTVTVPVPTDAGDIIIGVGENWIGPYFMDVSDMNRIFTNFVAPQGLYYIDKDISEEQKALNLTIALEVTPCDAAANPTGSPVVFTIVLSGSPVSYSLVAKTLKCAGIGFSKVRARRVTGYDHPFDRSRYSVYQDTVQWTDLYSVTPVSQPHFGNVTTVMAVTQATRDARSNKERKLNMLVTREVPHRISGTTFSAPMATSSASDIIVALALDPFIGRRTLDELDLDSIYNTVADVVTYFPLGTKCAQFNYTFDKNETSFEESIASIATAIFCQAYRQGNKLRLKFEKLTPDSVLMFNHRNKVPGTETRTVRFGNQDDYDGVEYHYVSPLDDAPVTYYIPEDMSAANPKKIDSIGVRSRIQAYYQAWRVWNKIRYQNVTVEFEATQEADLLVVLDRILVADNTRPETQDGEVIAQNGLELTLSQDVHLS